jgi:hypothetical protein
MEMDFCVVFCAPGQSPLSEALFFSLYVVVLYFGGKISIELRDVV